MTAPDSTRPESQNSTVRPQDGHDAALHTDARHRSAVEYLNQRDTAVARAQLAADAGWTLEETTDVLAALEAGNYVQIIDDLQSPLVLLTERGEALAEAA